MNRLLRNPRVDDQVLTAQLLRLLGAGRRLGTEWHHDLKMGVASGDPGRGPPSGRPSVRLPCKPKGPRLSLLRVGIGPAESGRVSASSGSISPRLNSGVFAWLQTAEATS